MKQETNKMTAEEELKNLENQVSEEFEESLEKTDSNAEEASEEEASEEEVSEETEDALDGEDSKETEEKKGFFKKKKDKKDEKIQELNDKYIRQVAEFDNYRKRTEKEKTQMYEIGAKSVIEKILPIVDSFERGLAAVTEEEKELPFVDGMNKVYKQLMASLEEINVKPIEAVGCPFDPNLHNAVMVVEDSGQEEDTIVTELQKGYTYRDSVVRHSMVQVAK